MATNELAGITLAVDVSQVDRGTQSLQKFRQANQHAASSSASVGSDCTVDTPPSLVFYPLACQCLHISGSKCNG